MGLKDLKPTDDFDAVTQEILNEPGLNAAQRDACIAAVEKATANVADATEKAQKGLKVARAVAGVLKDPVAFLTSLGLW